MLPNAAAQGYQFQVRNSQSANNLNLLTWTDAIIAQGPPCSWIRALGSSVEKIKPKGNNTSNQNKNNIIVLQIGKCNNSSYNDWKTPLITIPSNEPPASTPCYTCSCQLFLNQWHEIFILGMLGFSDKSWSYWKMCAEISWRSSEDFWRGFKHFLVQVSGYVLSNKT